MGFSPKFDNDQKERFMSGKAIILVSGGMDSLVTAAIASKDHELAFLHVNYGQRTQEQRLVVDISYLAKIGGSSLTDDSIEVSIADLKSKEIPTSYVPFRNANILSIAVSWAEVIGAKRIFIGAVEEDSSGYPDCRQVFYDSYNKTIELGTKPGSGIKIETPIIKMNKSEIIKKGASLNAPFRLSWSCYKNEDKACGECDSCALRLKGFQQAGLVDPIDYIYRPLYNK